MLALVKDIGWNSPDIYGVILMSITRTIATIIVVILLASLLSSIAIAATSPTIPPKYVPPTSGGGGGGGGGGSYTPMSVTPTPAPTPVPPYRLDAKLPSKVDINNVPVKLSGNTASVSQGYYFPDVVRNKTLEVPLGLSDGGTGTLVLTIAPKDSLSGEITSIHLLVNKTLKNSTMEIGVNVDVELAQLPEGGGISFDLLSLDARNISAINDQLAAYSDKQFNTTPLFVFGATKNGLQNGKDIRNVTFTFTIPRPDNFDPAATYSVIRENDGAYDLLDATLVSAPDANPLVFQVVSPRGLSTFSLVEETHGHIVQPSSTPVPVTPVPTVKSTPVASNEVTTGSLAVWFGIFLAGIIVGVIALVFILWLRVR